MRLLNTADWHLNSKKDIVWDGVWSRRKEQEKNIFDLIKIIKKEKVDLLNILGDIFDSSRPSAEDIGFFISFLNKLEKEKILTRIFQGNHDIGLNENVLTKALNKIKYDYIQIIDKPCCFVDKKINTNFIYIPFEQDLDYKEIFEKGFVLNEKENNIIFIHDVFTKAEMGREKFIIRGKMNNIDKLNNKIDCVFAGHIHKQQNCNDLVYYPGAISPMSFGEQEDKQGYIIADIEKDNISVKLYQFKNMEWKTIELDNDKKLPALTKYKNCLLRIRLKIKQKDKKGFDREQYKKNIENKTKSKILKLEFEIKENEKKKKITINKKQSPSQQFKKYIESKDFNKTEIKKIEKEFNEIIGEI